jgi:putative copper export protein
MQRCKQCESSLAKGDTACVNCGELVKPVKPKANLRQRFGKLVTVLFILSAALTLVALFTSYVGSFVTLLATTIVLLMVKKSADEMSSSEQ